MKAALFLALLIAAPALAKGPVPVPASALIIERNTPELAWRWRVAPEVARQPALLQAMRVTALRDAARARTAAAGDAAQAAKGSFPFRRHEEITDWALVADTPQLLAMTGLRWAYTGGAHGNTGYQAKIWDKTVKRELPFEALFTDWPRARALLEPMFCAALAVEQKNRRGADSGPFDACPAMIEQAVVPLAGDTGLASVARQFRVSVAPYAAGSYAEGSYIIDVVWPETVKPLVKPHYRADLFGTP